jgi:hypothetical protein
MANRRTPRPAARRPATARRPHPPHPPRPRRGPARGHRTGRPALAAAPRPPPPGRLASAPGTTRPPETAPAAPRSGSRRRPARPMTRRGAPAGARVPARVEARVTTPTARTGPGGGADRAAAATARGPIDPTTTPARRTRAATIGRRPAAAAGRVRPRTRPGPATPPALARPDEATDPRRGPTTTIAGPTRCRTDPPRTRCTRRWRPRRRWCASPASATPGRLRPGSDPEARHRWCQVSRGRAPSAAAGRGRGSGSGGAGFGLRFARDPAAGRGWPGRR